MVEEIFRQNESDLTSLFRSLIPGHNIIYNQSI